MGFSMIFHYEPAIYGTPQYDQGIDVLPFLCWDYNPVNLKNSSFSQFSHWVLWAGSHGNLDFHRLSPRLQFLDGVSVINHITSSGRIQPIQISVHRILQTIYLNLFNTDKHIYIHTHTYIYIIQYTHAHTHTDIYIFHELD